MAKPGRKPTPTARLRLNGSWRADTRHDDLAVPEGLPECPGWLGDDERAGYADLVDRLAKIPGLLCPLDGWAVSLLADAVVEYRALTGIVRRDGDIIETPRGPTLNPVVLCRQDAWKRCKIGFSQFGMTPADRASLGIRPPDDPGGGRLVELGVPR
ncbi:MAG: P27 family phage terminase small subunit [Phycisphaerales bacterium]|nr:P27 family phage terminase small subunit [Phycisphaerales bacterium]